MNISAQFNKFYHSAVLTELFSKANSLKFKEWVDIETKQVLTFIRGEHYSEMEELKQILKNMNLDYEVDIDKKLSTTKICSKALSQHIDWVIQLAAENNIEFGFVEDEWQRLLEQAHKYER